MVHKLITGP